MFSLWTEIFIAMKAVTSGSVIHVIPRRHSGSSGRFWISLLSPRTLCSAWNICSSTSITQREPYWRRKLTTRSLSWADLFHFFYFIYNSVTNPKTAKKSFNKKLNKYRWEMDNKVQSKSRYNTGTNGTDCIKSLLRFIIWCLFSCGSVNEV